MKKLLLIILTFTLTLALAGCKSEPNVPLTYTVTFETNGGTVIATQEIENGGKVTEPDLPTKDGYAFSGDWLNGTFVWNFEIDIVTEDITLVAEWILVSTIPQNIEMTSDAFSSSVTWVQSDSELQVFTVSVKADGETTYTVIAGSVSIEAGDLIDTVTFTPTVIPMGGYYVVKIDTGVEVAESDQVVFGGTGTEVNPYVVNDVSDILTILDDVAFANKHFLQIADVLMTLDEPIEINDDRKVAFSGVYDGGNFAISFGGNGALFHEITATGVVKNIEINSATQLSAAETNLYPIGVIADTNNGLIQNVSSRALVVNVRLQGALPVFAGTVDTSDNTTGAGGVVGINGSTGIIRDVVVGGSGAVKAGRGVGGVSAYNYGLIERAIITATLPAGNQSNSGLSSNTYSYGGGIAGFNFGTINECAVSGRVFAQSAYSVSGDGNEGKNVAFGGIAGYNEGTITHSSFARSLEMKEFIDKLRAEELLDSANNLGVGSINGDLYIGGIAGINAGEIEYSYVGGALVSGRDFVGGVTGLTLGSGSIENTYVFAEVAIKDEGGVKITAAGTKTTLSVYEIAPSGFNATTVFYKALLNSVSSNTWVPGDYEIPMLPEFNSADLTKVGAEFTATGLLVWQTGVVDGVNITLDTVVLPHGSTILLEYFVTPIDAPDVFTVWTSSDENIVQIVGEGSIKGVGAGEATVTVTTRDGGYVDTIIVTVDDYVKIDSVVVTSPEITLPDANNIDDRQLITIGTSISFDVAILPETADYQNYTITTSNSRAEVVDGVVTFVYGLTGPGNVSVNIIFDDSSFAPLEYRFLTEEGVVADISIEDVTVTGDVFTLPVVNDINDRPTIDIGTVLTLTVDILPITATNQNYTITSSNSSAVVDGNVVTFVYGDTGPGNVSIILTFEDPAIGVLEYRFVTFQPISITSVIITGDVLIMPSVNNVDDRLTVTIGTVLSFTVDILPFDATNQNYTITTSNSRAEVVDGVVTFVYGLTGPGRVSVFFTFEDPAIGILEFRFLTIE